MDVRLALLTVVIGSGVGLVAPPADAAPCSERNPAVATEVDRRNMEDGRVRIVKGRTGSPPPLVEYKVQNCEIAAQEQPVEVHGVEPERAVTARLVPKSPHDLSLIITPDAKALRPGRYDLSLATRSGAVPLVAKVSVDVKDGALKPPLVAWFVGCVIGVGILALRAAAASPEGWRAFPAFFTDPKALVPGLGGSAVAMTALRTQFFSSHTWFGSTEELLGLAVAAGTAVVVGGTLTTAVTGVVARTERRA